MATKIVSTVQECAISKAVENSSDKYSPDTLMRYHTSAETAVSIMAQRYGIPTVSTAVPFGSAMANSRVSKNAEPLIYMKMTSKRCS